jgi:hypothetical protein
MVRAASESDHEPLRHVRWIGGAPLAGKTTVSRILAGKFDLKLYNLDWHHVRDHLHRIDPERHPRMYALKDASLDERWLLKPVDEMVRDYLSWWRCEFAMVVEDLAALSSRRIVIAEGPGALPDLVAPLILHPRQGVWLVPTPQFKYDAQFRRADAWSTMSGTTDPLRAQRNRIERDLRLAEHVRARAGALGLHTLKIDGTRSVDEVAWLIEEWFDDLLPKAPNV